MMLICFIITNLPDPSCCLSQNLSFPITRNCSCSEWVTRDFAPPQTLLIWSCPDQTSLAKRQGQACLRFETHIFKGFFSFPYLQKNNVSHSTFENLSTILTKHGSNMAKPTFSGHSALISHLNKDHELK